MLRQEPLRFLLADDAGAGKTIMTGLYVREMLSRGRIRRVLIVPPAGLVGNWERELRTLFGLRFRIAAGADNPFRGADGDRVIVSLDTLTGERRIDIIQGPISINTIYLREGGQVYPRQSRYRRHQILGSLKKSGLLGSLKKSGLLGSLKKSGLSGSPKTSAPPGCNVPPDVNIFNIFSQLRIASSIFDLSCPRGSETTRCAYRYLIAPTHLPESYASLPFCKS